MPANITLSETFVYYFEGTFFIFWCITVPLYIFLIFSMIRAQMKKVTDLSTPFFQICIASSIIDLVTLINNYIGAVFPKWGWWSSVYIAMGQPYLKIYFYIAWATGICQALSVSIMATNRLYAMVHPENYSKFWQGWRLRLAICSQFLLGMTCSVVNFFADTELVPGDNGIGLIPKISNKTTSKIFFAIGGCFLAINSLYLVVAYCYLYGALHTRHQHQIENRSISRIEQTKVEAKRREHRLFLMATCVVAVQLAILCFFSTSVFPIFTLTTEQFYMFYNALSDFYSGVNPYLILAFSDVLRAYIKSMIFCSKPDTQTQSVISTRHFRAQTPNTIPTEIH